MTSKKPTKIWVAKDRWGGMTVYASRAAAEKEVLDTEGELYSMELTKEHTNPRPNLQHAVVTKDLESGYVQVFRTFDKLEDAESKRAELGRDINKHGHRCNIAIVSI